VTTEKTHSSVGY